MTFLELLTMVNNKLPRRQRYSDDFINILNKQAKNMKLYIALQWLYESRYYKLFKLMAVETPLYKILDKANKQVTRPHDILQVFKICLYWIYDHDFTVTNLIRVLEDSNYKDLAAVLSFKER